MARPTMEDVAARAGVSRALVSLVMRGSAKVSERRRQAVLDAAAELGYAPHAMARSLASRTSTLLGVLVSDLHNPFFAEIVDGIDEVARAEGFELILNTGGLDVERERDAVTRLLSFRPAGLALLGAAVPAEVIADAAGQSSVVVVARPARIAGVDSVNDDGGLGARLAVDHLVELGHTRITHFDGGRTSEARIRREGYAAAMRAHGLRPDVVRSEYTDAGGEKAATLLLERGGMLPTAVVAANDVNAVGALSVFSDAGLAVPSDISVVGYDNTALSGLRHIGLTTVDQPRAEMGRLAARALVERARGERGAARRRLVTPSLVVRSTTAPPRAPGRT
ncbi:LacI family DNA-binding transcriptional regulator [Haloechinothrix salitolerans]|uniref:LacI family DNA-binding transcriptional regulator n=1 Tax=Haloechinothrix salitolerans TaxID=926830 RepID=A0ABW2C771_9PSEU